MGAVLNAWTNFVQSMILPFNKPPIFSYWRDHFFIFIFYFLFLLNQFYCDGYEPCSKVHIQFNSQLLGGPLVNNQLRPLSSSHLRSMPPHWCGSRVQSGSAYPTLFLWGSSHCFKCSCYNGLRCVRSCFFYITHSVLQEWWVHLIEEHPGKIKGASKLCSWVFTSASGFCEDKWVEGLVHEVGGWLSGVWGILLLWWGEVMGWCSLAMVVDCAESLV